MSDIAGTGSEAGDMAAQTDAALEPAGRAPRRNHFRPSSKSRMPPEAAARQGTITTLALEAFGNASAAIGFLNGEDAGLAGRPLAIATTSAEGWAAVEAEIRRRFPDAASR